MSVLRNITDIQEMALLRFSDTSATIYQTTELNVRRKSFPKCIILIIIHGLSNIAIIREAPKPINTSIRSFCLQTAFATGGEGTRQLLGF
jgi:hypothetical protein